MMKKTDCSMKKAFTIAELLISMLIVCVIAAALVPMIGPKKTKAIRQKMIHGFYACYWAGDPQEGTLTLANAAYSKNQNKKGEGHVDAAHNRCEFDPPKANFYNIIVIGASGDGVTNPALQSRVGWQDSVGNSKGPLYSEKIPISPSFNYAINNIGNPIIEGLLDLVFQNNGPLAATITMQSGSEGNGSGATQTDDTGWDDTGLLALTTQGNPDAPGAPAGSSKSLNAYVWLNRNSSLDFGYPSVSSSPVSLRVDGNGMDAYFELTSAGRGSDAFDLFNGSNYGQNGWSFEYAGNTYSLQNGTRVVVNSSTVNGTLTAHRVGDPNIYRTYNIPISSIMQYQGRSFSRGSDSAVTANTLNTTVIQSSGHYNCNVSSGVCRHGYRISNNGSTGAAVGSIQATSPADGFPWQYRGLGIKLFATLSGDPGKYRIRMFNKLDGKVYLYPAKLNTKNGLPNGELTSSVVKFQKTNSQGEVTLMEVESGKSADPNGYWETPQTVNSPDGYMDYKKEFGVFPLSLGVEHHIIPEDVLGLPVDVGINYVPGKAGNGAFPLVKELHYMPRAKITTATNTFEYNIEDEAFDVDFSDIIANYKCPDGVSSPKQHYVYGKTQSYCEAKKGNPGIVVITW